MKNSDMITCLCNSNLFFFSELDHEEVGRCISWMTPYAQAVNATGYPQIRSSSSTEDQSNYQSHSVDIKLLELAHSTAEMLRENDPMMIF